MVDRRFVASLAFATSILAHPAGAQGGAAHIPRSQIEAIFADMKAHTSWDVGGKLLWGYYFTSTSKPALETAANLLVGQGYTLVEIRELPGSASDGAVWQLHVERVEHHTPDSLVTRDDELYAFASSRGLAGYDGMDVGPVK